MAVECIHGLDEAQCDLCNPKPVPKVEAAPSRSTRPRAATSLRSTPVGTSQPRVAKSRVAGAAGPSVSSVDQRIYHVTHLRNLESILSSGCLLADAGEPGPEVDISSAGNREERRAAVVGAESAAAGSVAVNVVAETVADFVPFFVTPDSAVWQGMRASAPDPRLSPEVRQLAPAEFVVLVSTVGKAGRENSVVAVGDAADSGTRFATTPEQSARELGRMRSDEDAMARAEFLVRESLPFESVTLIGVANDKARNEVRAILAESDYNTKVSIYPPWFARPEG